MLLRQSDQKLTRRQRLGRLALVSLGIPMFLVAAYVLEGLNNPSLFSENYLRAEYEPIVLWPKHHGYKTFDRREPIVASTRKAIKNWVGGMQPTDSDVPTLVLDVKYEYMNKIFNQRDQALRHGRLIQSDDSFVKGKIRERSGSIPVKLRLKGDFLDHLQGRKWSFRIHTRKGNHFLGMRKFSVQHPKVRAYQAERLFFDSLRRYGVLAPRWRLVNLVLNGDDLGIMAMEEHFSKELLESQSRREGIVLRFDESLVWTSPDGNIRHFGGIYDDYRNATVDAFQTSKVFESPVLTEHYRVATGMMRSFMAGESRASDVFDAESLGAYLAVADVFGSEHTIRWHNLRFYVNPITLKLEPIGFDSTLNQRQTALQTVMTHEPIIGDILQDPLIMQRFREVLAQIAEDAQSGDLLDFIESIEAPVYSAMQSEYPYLSRYPAQELYDRALYLNTLADADFVKIHDREVEGLVAVERYPTAGHAYRVMDGGVEYLELDNAIPYAVSIQSIRPAALVWKELEIDLPALPTVLPAREIDAVNGVVRIPIPEHLRNTELLVTGTAGDRPFELPVRAYFTTVGAPAIHIDEAQAIAEKFAFINVDEERRAFSFDSGSWDVPELVSFPEGYSVNVGPATELRFGEDAGLVIRGKAMFNGTAEQPIQLGPDPRYSAATWLGLAVLDAGESSELSHVNISSTRGMSVGPWLLMGGTNFFRSPVTIESTSIRDLMGEDGLNIISSAFVTRDLKIENTLSDGFDCDFCTGDIVGGQFAQIGTAGGGDAIDVSLSDINIIDVHFIGVTDKAVSIGERSQAKARGLLIESVGTGAAAKDGSTLTIENSTIKSAQVAALMAYIKKPEFGQMWSEKAQKTT